MPEMGEKPAKFKGHNLRRLMQIREWRNSLAIVCGHATGRIHEGRPDAQRTEILERLHPHPGIACDELDGLHHSERRLRALLAATSDAVYRMSPDFTLMYQLDGHGFLPDSKTPSVSWQEEYLFEEDRAAIMAVVTEAVRTRGIFQHEHRVRRVDGSAGWTFSRAIPIADGSGDIVEWFGAASDITGRKRQEELTTLLTLEVHHRLKNTLGLVQAIANGTFRSDTSSEELKTFDGRLQALAAAQDVLIGSQRKSGDVREVVTRALRAMPQSRIDLDGPVALLQAEEALGLALAIHELCTNASKYGALSTRTGRVSVRWTTDGSVLKLQWRESGGKAVSPPTHRGFGTRILERVIRRDAAGSIELDYAPDGLVCSIKLPMIVAQ